MKSKAPAADKRKEELRMLAALPAVKASLYPRPRYNYSSQVSNLISFDPPLLLSSILHAQPLRPHYHVLHREAIFIEAAGGIDLRGSGCEYKLEEREGG